MNRTHTQASTSTTQTPADAGFRTCETGSRPLSPSLPLKSRKLAITVVVIGRRNGQGSVDSAQGGADGNECHLSLRLEVVVSTQSL